MYWPIKDFSINDVYLDTKNIRLPFSDQAQDAILQDLFSNEDAFEILKSIVQYGIFPDEFPIFVKEHNKVVVIEGNRRIAALKALNDPSKVPFYKERIKNLEYIKINKIKAVHAPNRSKATSLIANKHTINLRRPWKPLRQAYFYKSQIDNGKSIDVLISEYPDHDIPKFVKMLEMHHLAKSISYSTELITSVVHDERKFPITNLERMYDDNYVTTYLGISFDKKGKLKGNVKIEDFSKPFNRIVEDVATGEIDSRKYNSKKQRKKYIDKLPKTLKPKSGSGSFNSSSFKEIKVEVKPRSNKKIKGLIPSYVPFKLNSSSLKALYVELRNIVVSSYPNATHDLLRSFLECSLVYFLKETGEYNQIVKNIQHKPKLDEMLTFISSVKCTSITDSNIKQIADHMKRDYNQPYSLARMNMVNHNENWAATEKEVRAAWSKLEKLMTYLLNPLKNSNN